MLVSTLGRRVMKNKLLIAAACVAGIVGVRALIAAPGWFKERRENRQFIAVNNVTPERLIARCGPPMGDQTRDLYPIVARDMRYKSESGGIIVFKFISKIEKQSLGRSFKRLGVDTRRPRSLRTRHTSWKYYGRW